MNHQRHKRKDASLHRAFGLAEVLVAVVIIGVLAGIGFFCLSSQTCASILSPRRTIAKNDVLRISDAVLRYETEYGKLPPGGADGTVDGTLMRVLTATEEANEGNPFSDNTVYNPRKIVFLEVNAASKNRSGINENGDFLDPWGNVYQITLDRPEYEPLRVPDYKGRKEETLTRRVGVWTITNGKHATPISSWD